MFIQFKLKIMENIYKTNRLFWDKTEFVCENYVVKYYNISYVRW